MDEDELTAWAVELLLAVGQHCHCGCQRNPLLRLRVVDRLRLWQYAVRQALLPAVPYGVLDAMGEEAWPGIPPVELPELPELPELGQ